jgi:HAD superfamily hydrolase (TIGR01509 family)
VSFKGIIFDLDGTIIDVPYDWPKIRIKLGMQGTSILSALEALAEPERTRKLRLLKRYEDEATRQARLKPGTKALLGFLALKKLKTALVSNNSRRNVDLILAKFGLAFDCILTRECGLWKPSGKPLRKAMRLLGLKSQECIAVGDSHYDLLAAADAGIEKVFLISRDKGRFGGSGAELCFSLGALQRKIGQMLRNGKS